jgi:hypothetical protein
MRPARLPPLTIPRRSALALGLLLGAGLPPGAPAQGRKAEIPIPVLATMFLEGRFRMPVTCTRTDGAQVEVEESVSFRPAVNRDGTQTLRMTFYGLAGSDLERCYNLVYPSIPDRRGVLYVSYSSRDRRGDTGVKNFTRAIQRGPLEYVITGGRLHIRDPDQAKEEARVVHFDGRSTPLLVALVPQDSDPDKLLGKAPVVRGRIARKLMLRFEGPDGLRFENAYLEDSSRF